MELLDYTFVFSPIKDKHSSVQVINYRGSQSQASFAIQVGAHDYDLLIKSNRRIPSISADLIDVATAIYIADRISIRQDDMPCKIGITIPVRNINIMRESNIIKKFQDILEWYTNDFWTIEFTHYDELGRLSEIQIPLNETFEHSTKVALWSGGLDSLAGLCQQLLTYPTYHFTLLGTGSNLFVDHLQKHVYESLNERFPNRNTLIQVPTYVKYNQVLPKDSSQRARGLFFLLQGIACAYTLGQKTLYLYENGIGAINLPFTKSEIGLDHSRSVHPLSLQYLSELASLVFGTSFNIYNPFMFSTKAEMCQVLCSNNSSDLMFETITCDRRHRKAILQCGYCSSCLLRRQAIAALKIKDNTKYIITEKTT